MDVNLIEARKSRARSWFEALRDDIVSAFEALEDALPGKCTAFRSRRRPVYA